MTRASETILDQAAAWHAASSLDSMDWDGFTAWLEADERHRHAYDEVSQADALLAEHAPALHWPQAEPELPELLAANDEPAIATPLFRRRWLAGAIAASLVALLALPQLMTQGPQVYQSGAAPLKVALEDGSQVMLAPRSRLEISSDEQEQMALEGGAWFDIRHRPSRTLAISAGGLTISDIGTRFDVQASARQLRVEVGEGVVTVSGPVLSAPMRLTQGRALNFDPAAGTAWVTAVAAKDIGEWRSGRLSYDSAPLAMVAQDLSRYARVEVKLGHSIENRTFSGTLVIGDGQRAVQDLAQLMDLGVSGGAGSYRLDKSR
jgi:transmembrane sensor